MDKNISQAKNILVINLLYMGDLVFSIPFIRNLRSNFPSANIDIIVNSKFNELIECSPYIDNIYSYNKSFSLVESVVFGLRLRKNQYDLGLNIHGSLRSNLLMRIIKPLYTVGFANGIMRFMIDKPLRPLNNTHMVQVYLKFLRDLGIQNIDNKGLELTVPKSAQKQIEMFLKRNMLSKDMNLIGINTGGTWNTKRWTTEGFAKLADELQTNYNCKVVFLGNNKDQTRVKLIISLMKTSPIVVTGQTNLTELMALLEKCSLVISNDSGPVHLAAALGIPTVTIFGPSDEIKYEPYGNMNLTVKANLTCRPCGKHECPFGRHKCMEDISAEQVMGLINERGLVE